MCNIMVCLDLTFDLAVVTLILKILPGSYLRNCKVLGVDCRMSHWLGSVDILNHLLNCSVCKDSYIYIPR